MLSLLIAMLAAAPSFSAPLPPKESGARFDAVDFSLVPPKGWVRTQFDRQRRSTLAAWQAPPLTEQRGFIAFSFFPGFDMSDADFVRTSISKVGGERPGTVVPVLLKIGDEKHGYVAAYQARVLGSVAASGDPNATAKDLTTDQLNTEFVSENRVTVTCFSKPRYFAQVERDCQAALKSFRLAPRAKAPAPTGAVPLLR